MTEEQKVWEYDDRQKWKATCKSCNTSLLAFKPSIVAEWIQEHLVQYPHHTIAIEVTRIDQ